MGRHSAALACTVSSLQMLCYLKLVPYKKSILSTFPHSMDKTKEVQMRVVVGLNGMDVGQNVSLAQAEPKFDISKMRSGVLNQSIIYVVQITK